MRIGTEVAVPAGTWKVLSAYDKAKGGYVGNRENKGYGNSVLVQNLDTGEKMRFSHLSEVNVGEGETIDAGFLIGKSGATGNVTGPHLDLEYYTPSGTLADVTKTKYWKKKGIEVPQQIKDLGKSLNTTKDKVTKSLQAFLPSSKSNDQGYYNDYILNNL